MNSNKRLLIKYEGIRDKEKNEYNKQGVDIDERIK